MQVITSRATRTGHRLLLWALLLVLTGGLIAGCGGNDADAEEEGEVQYRMGEPIQDSTYAAIVQSDYGADTLTTAQFYRQFNGIARQFPQVAQDQNQARELRRNIIEDFVLRHLLFGEAEARQIMADTARVAQQLRQIRGQFETEEAYQQALAQENVTEDSLRLTIQEGIRQQMILENIAESAPEPTSEELEEFRQEQAAQVRVQHILFRTTPMMSEAEEDSIEEVAEAVLDSARSGEDFAALARRHSADGSAQAGGDLGFFGRGQMVPEFEEVAFSLADSGDVARDLVESQFGYHIIRLTGRRTTPLMDSTRARMQLVQQRRQEAVEEGIDELRTKATVRLNPTITDVDLNAERLF